MKPRAAAFILFIAAMLASVGLFRQASASKAPSTGEASDQIEVKAAGREDLRAFYTAPPVIPHEVGDRDSDECLHCHDEIKKLKDRVSVVTPHPQFSNCQQCHVSIMSRDGVPGEEPVNSWAGLEEPKEGTRAHEFAPPTQPHRTFLREDCNVCHSNANPNEEVTGPHRQRSNCAQCHVLTDPSVEF